MKFNFKIQQYQTDAVEAVARVFNGQGHYDKISYIRDLGKKKANQQMGILAEDEFGEVLDLDSDTGYKNEMVELSDDQLLKNIQQLQNENNIKMSTSLVKDLGRCSLDIEMETGTGKTYVYIKTMFELNKRYGWSKFIVIVPSIAIREGVKKSFEMRTIQGMGGYISRVEDKIKKSNHSSDTEKRTELPAWERIQMDSENVSAAAKQKEIPTWKRIQMDNE